MRTNATPLAPRETDPTFYDDPVDRSLPPIAALIALAVGAALVTLLACTVWHGHHDDVEAKRSLAHTYAELDRLVASMRAGTPYQQEPYVHRPVPLPARSPIGSAVVIGLVVLASGRVLVFMHRVERRT
jgi:hypothetical protein